MKVVTHYRHTANIIPYRNRKAVPFPNAADKKRQFDKILDYTLTAAISIGIVTALLFLMTLF